MSFVGKRRVASKYKRRVGNPNAGSTQIKRVLYNPYTKKLYVSRKRTVMTHTPQFKLGRKIETSSEWHGDNMEEFPSPTVTRFVLQNCNGLPTTRDTNFFKSDMTELISKDIHFLALPECNVNCINVEVTNGYKEAFASITNNGVFTATNAPIFEPSVKYQPGGVATGFHGQLISRYIRQTQDKYG